MITLIIDNREQKLYKLILERDLDIYLSKINIENSNLELGDIKIIIEHDNNKRELVFERKTLNDLNSSIKDGRYKEQKTRLLANYSNSDITYIIEEDSIEKSIKRNDNKISSVYIHSLYRDNIHLFFTNNIFETINIIITLCKKIINNPHHFINNNLNKIEEYTNCIKIKSKKIKNITPDNCFILQLAQIPTISNKLASNIVNVYSNIRELINDLDKYDNEKDKINILSKIDKIGKEKAKKIIEYMKL